MSELSSGTPRAPPGTLAERIFIVPAAHTRIGDVLFQVEMYELFHRTPGGRLGHMLGTPTVLFGVLMLLSRAPGPAVPLLAGALILGMAALGAAVDRLAGMVTAVLGVALAVAAAAVGRALGSNVASFAVALVLGGCGLQTFSHMFEDVPPPQSGTSEFLPLRTWLARIGVVELLRSTALTFAVFYWLELWASLRILPIQALHVLMRAGHRPDLRRALDARVAEILAAPGGDWRRPRTRGALRGERCRRA